MSWRVPGDVPCWPPARRPRLSCSAAPATGDRCPDRTRARHTGTGAKTAALTAVSGCAGLEQADGTLDQVNGSSLVITTANGQPVTATTTASTMVSISRAPLTDITDGASVNVLGPSSDGTIAAENVVVGSPPGSGRGGYKAQTPPGIVRGPGDGIGRSTAGFTVVTSSGTGVPVTTSSETAVNVLHASPGQLQAGASTVAVGYAGPDGTLAAIAVAQPPPGWNGQLQVAAGCSPTSIDDAITTALVSGG